MSSLPTAYTPLESLLLFQALRAGGIESNVFNRISEDLKSIPLVRNDPSYNPARLSPDALRQLYLDLLKEEAKRDLERQLNTSNVSPGSRKRKAPSPTLPTIHEAAQHSHLIPQLVARLYTRYREITVRAIRESERRYEQIVRDVGDIKAGKWDEKLQKQGTSPVPNPKSLSTQTKDGAISGGGVQSPVVPRDASQVKVEAIIHHDPRPDTDSSGLRKASSNAALPPLSEMAVSSPRNGISPSFPTISNTFQPSPPLSHSGTFPPHHGSASTSAVGSPQLMSRTSPSPRPILPPPPGMSGSSAIQSSPHQHGQGIVGRPVPTYPSPTRTSAVYGHGGPHSQHILPGSPPAALVSGRGYTLAQPPQMASSTAYYQQQPHQDHRVHYSQPHGQSPTGHGQQASAPGGFMLPPFQVTSHDPTKPQQPSTPGGPHQPAANNARYPQTHRQQQLQQQQQQYQMSAPATGPRLQTQPNQRLMSEVLAALATPPRQHRQPVWKSETRPPPTLTPSSPRRPDIEPLSPQLARVPSPVRVESSIRRRDAVQNSQGSTQPARPLRKSRNAREGSVASSTADRGLRATRSASVSSAVDSTPAPEDRQYSKRQVKAEPSTPGLEYDDASVRTRRGTVQPLTQSLSSTKRRREHSADTARDRFASTEPTPRGNTISATRNFAKMSSVIMNDINSHKHGSRFAQPVRDKVADGYSTFIKRPQDLKSIRGAITHGARAITAATASVAESPSATAKGADTTAELERTIDLIPPKAIVNGAQLEMEIMRMFANAVMFNPGEDGMVADAREMFDDVEAKISEWRGAERDIAPASSAVEEEDDGRAKRRKV